jgi:hypothetical protein
MAYVFAVFMRILAYFFMSYPSCMNLQYIVADEIGHFASVFFDIMAKIY